MQGRELAEYHVFLASPGDVGAERELVRSYVDGLNRSFGATRRVRFQVVDWENFATAGVGRPQELITRQTLERFRNSLALVVVIMGERFGTPSGAAESGTEEEVRWALRSHEQSAFPEVKFFFRETGQFVAPADRKRIQEALDQWSRVQEFRDELEEQRAALVRSYAGPHDFERVLRDDLDLWFHADDRPWAGEPVPDPALAVSTDEPPEGYLAGLVRAFESLDISGIDSDQAFDLPLDRIYVQLRVISGDDEASSAAPDEPALLGISTALERYPRLVIVGDPGSGKSTFLRFIALTLGQCRLTQDAHLAVERLSLAEPLPIPVFLSCWDLAEHLRTVPRATLDELVDFVVARVREGGWPVDRAGLERLLGEGRCIVLVDGLDEVPTDEGRHLVRRLIEELVARHPGSRYVITSRIRAYTGETVLGQQFARCDIQPFSAEERTAFLRNWVGQLFRVRGQNDAARTEAADEIAALTQAIETSSIRLLAVNPLLLTVIAIVHWNRKRLPEQRVDLYDECIDVLLGQRKQAEQHRTARDTRVLDEAYNDHRVDDRAKVRKRFAEIPYNILSRSGEEIDRPAVLDLLEPHFRTSDDESARRQAERFLDRQELRSGLLVSRRSASYRFVHLTFQEYLAAWYLAGRDLSATLEAAAPHLREPTWFETLQLLGGELANRSDDFLDRYVGWLLDHAGQSVQDQAPVVALAANIVRDTQAVASVSSETQARYEALLRETLDAFLPQSKVPKQTQLDLLEAFGKLGASVKGHLISATGSRLLDVRKRALEMLVEHLSDDDLFSMTHVLADRSKEPVKTYITALVARDRVRAGRVLLDLSRHGEKTLDAIVEAPDPRLPPDGLENWPRLLAQVAEHWYQFRTTREERAFALLTRWDDRRDATRELLEQLAEAGSDAAVGLLSRSWPDSDETWTVIRRRAEAGSREAVQALTRGRGDRDDTWDLLARLAETGSPTAVLALLELRGFRDDAWTLIGRLSNGSIRTLAADDRSVDRLVRVVSMAFPGRDEYWEVIRQLAAAGSTNALYALLDRRPDETTLQLLGQFDDGVLADLIGNGRDVKLSQRLRWLALGGARNGREAALRMLRALAAAGSLPAVSQLVECGDDRDEVLELVGGVGDDLMVDFVADWESPFELVEQHDSPIATIVRASVDATRWDLVRLLAAAGSATALYALLEEQGVVLHAGLRHFAAEGHPAFVEQLIAGWGDHDEVRAWIRGRARRTADWLTFLLMRWPDRDTWELVEDCARAGAPRALQILHDKRADCSETWELIRDAAAAGSVEALRLLVRRKSGRAAAWDTLDGFSDDGLKKALSILVYGHGAVPETRARVAALAASGSTPAVRLLVDQWWNSPGTVELVDRLAAEGSAEALRILVEGRSTDERTWAMIASAAQHGNAVARSYQAWHDWARATGDPTGAAEMLRILHELVPADRA
jgi:NACHT domain